MTHAPLQLIAPFDVEAALVAPATFIYTGPMSTFGHRLNRFALSLKSAANRARFLKDERHYMAEYELSESEMALVSERDWTGLLRAGVHLQAALKIAATVGENLWAIGAHNAGTTPAELIAACPRRVSGLPKGA